MAEVSQERCDASALVDPASEEVTAELMVERHRQRLQKLAEGRLYLPAEEPPGGPQHLVRERARLPARQSRWPTSPSTCWPSPASSPRTATPAMTTSSTAGFRACRTSPGWWTCGNPSHSPSPEQYALTEATAELASSCYAGVLMLQAMGLGG